MWDYDIEPEKVVASETPEPTPRFLDEVRSILNGSSLTRFFASYAALLSKKQQLKAPASNTVTASSPTYPGKSPQSSVSERDGPERLQEASHSAEAGLQFEPIAPPQITASASEQIKTLLTIPPDVLAESSARIVKNPNGSSMEFDEQDNITAVVNAKGQRSEFSYSNGKLASMRDSRGYFTTPDGLNWYREGNAELSSPNWRGRIAIDPDGTIREREHNGRTITWNLDGSRIVKNRNGSSLTMDAQANITEIIDAKRRKTTFTYNSKGEIVTMADPSGLYYTPDGVKWYKQGNSPPNPPDWTGRVTISEGNEIIEHTHMTGERTTRLLDGTVHTSGRKVNPEEFVEFALQLFPAIDTDGDGFMSSAELGCAVQHRRFTGRDAQVVAALYKNRQQLQQLSNDEWGRETSGITVKDLQALNERIRTGDSIVGDILETLDRTYIAQSDASHYLYSNRNNPLTSIRADAVKQGMIGDCYFAAAVGSLAATNPELVHHMIKDNGNGTYTVTFPGAPNEPITVQAPTDAEMGLYNQASRYGLWPCILEKAYGSYCNKHFWRRSPLNMGGGTTDSEGADGGEHPALMGRAMGLLTGKDRDLDIIDLTSESDTRRKLVEAFTSSPKRPVIAGTIGLAFGLSPADTKDGFARAHAYSVTDFDPDGPDGGTVTIRNPWGGSDRTTSGTIKISLKQFQKNFFCVAYSQG